VSQNAIYLKQMELGPMQNFVYLVGDPVARQCVVVDPAWEIDTIVDTAAADGMTITGALVTHTHQDHVGGSLESWGMPAGSRGWKSFSGASRQGLRAQGGA
jgi:glyoxylase-like metal-dependent hydrolase (beta-lactamase superfamily II)